MYLKNITINNFKSIQKATVVFENGLNIVIGKNGTGKSNLLQFIYRSVYYYAITNRTTPFFRNNNLNYAFTICYGEEDRFENELTLHLKRERNIVNSEIEYSTDIKINNFNSGKSQKWEKNYFIPDRPKVSNDNDLKELTKEIEFLKSFRRVFVPFEIPENPYWLGQPDKFEIDEELYANSTGGYDGFSIVLRLHMLIEMKFITSYSLKFEDINIENVKEFFFEIFKDLEEKYQLTYFLPKYSPIQEIRLNPNINVYKADNKILVENLLIDFNVNDNWIPWSYLSDGTKRLFYLITECLSVENGLILIEEPELGVHPTQLFSLMEFIKEQSATKQIIISTHSPIVLDILAPNELNRITIAKLTKEGTQFYKLDEKQKETAQKYMSEVGDLSYYWLHSDLENE